MKTTTARRQFLTMLCAASTSLVLTDAARAGTPVVEIIAFAHPPVQSALKPLRDWLAKQGSRLKVVEIDMETPAGEKRLQAIGVKDHQPIVVLINGSFRHQVTGGKTVEFVGFPASPGTPAGVAAGWSTADVIVALK